MERPPLERAAFVSGACGGDELLRTDVLRLLSAHLRTPGFLESAGFLETDPIDLAGMQLGPYILLREIGRGGMGQVYLARDTRLDRSVAVKVLPSAAGQRFEREVHAAASLNHPHICSLYDIGHEAGLDYLVMEHLDGETLRERLRRGPLTSQQAMGFAVQIADALNAAHAKGFIHRDIKPANVMITARDEVKVLDFGLAKRAQVEPPEALTLPGLVVGTVEYMSPEQAAGRQVDARTDIFSLGVVLYEMVTARLPFPSQDADETVRRVNHVAPPPISGAPAGLMRIIHRCLERDPDRRYQSAAELQTDLSGLSGTHHVPQTTTFRFPPKKFVAAGVLLAIAATSVYFRTRSSILMPRRGETDPGRPPPSEANRVYSSIAVLPFSDMSPQRDQEYFCDGLTEEVINSMTKLDGLHVAARTSVFGLKGKELDIRKIGALLNVQTVLEGSVRKTGDHLRISAHLISLPGGYHLWSETYDRDLKDVFAIQEEIARAVVDAMKVKLRVGAIPQFAKRHTPDIAAYNLYLLGRYYFAKRPGEENWMRQSGISNRHFGRIRISRWPTPEWRILIHNSHSGTTGRLAR